MGKPKTSTKQKKFSPATPKLRLKKNMQVEEYSPTVHLADESFVALAIWDCLKDNDPAGVIEIIEAHLEAVNKLQFTKNSEIPRSTLYYLSKSRNPTLRTLARTISAVAYVYTSDDLQHISPKKASLRKRS